MNTPSEDSLFSVRDRLVVITGGLGQLGRQFAETFCARGAKVVILDRETPREKIDELLGEMAGQILFVPVDVTVRESLRAALREIEEKLGTPHVLINNAALDSPPKAPAAENGPFEDYPEESFDKVLDVNTKGVFLCSQVFGAAMAREGRGSIINIGSIYGVVSPDQRLYAYREKREGKPFFKPVAYSVSKSALLNLTKYLATYWAPRNVRVNILTFAGIFNNQDPEFLEGYCAKVPMGRMANPNEYNGIVVMLASEASSYMTGSNIVVDGGFTSW